MQRIKLLAKQFMRANRPDYSHMAQMFDLDKESMFLHHGERLAGQGDTI